MKDLCFFLLSEFFFNDIVNRINFAIIHLNRLKIIDFFHFLVLDELSLDLDEL